MPLLLLAGDLTELAYGHDQSGVIQTDLGNQDVTAGGGGHDRASQGLAVTDSGSRSVATPGICAIVQ